MSSLAYYLIFLGAALLLIAAASAMVVGHLRRGQRRLQAVALLDSLGRSTDWVEAQGRAVCFQAATGQRDPSLEAIRAICRQWFPELAAPADELVAVHLRMAELLQLHERLRGHDPEAWLEGGHDAAFMALRREHDAIAGAIEQRLWDVASSPLPLRRHTFPA